MVEAGRVEIRHGSVSSLPFADSTFDLVTAIESHYFRPDLVTDMGEILRVPGPGGLLMMMSGEYRGGKYDQRNERWVELGDSADHSIEESKQLFGAAGYTEVRVLEDRERGGMCCTGMKPC